MTLKPAMGYHGLCVPCMSIHCTHFASSIKTFKIQINFHGQTELCNNFPEGTSPLYAGVTPGSISKWQGGLEQSMH